MNGTAFGALLALAERLLVNSAQDDLDLQQAEEAAAAVRPHPHGGARRRHPPLTRRLPRPYVRSGRVQAGLTEGQKQGFLKFWKAQKQKIHEQLVKDALWGSRLKAFSWRIDVKTKSKHIRELNEPTAVLELDVANNDQVRAVR